MKKRIVVTLFTLVTALSLTGCATHSVNTSKIYNQDKTASAQTVSEKTYTAEETVVKDSEKTQKNDSFEPKDKNTVVSEEKKNSVSKATDSKSTGSKTTNSNTITMAKAKSIALNHAGVKSANVYDYEIELDYENGVKLYEISFNSGNYEYDYKINAGTGAVLRAKKEPERNKKPQTNPQKGNKPSTSSKNNNSSVPATNKTDVISKSKAKSIVLNHAGVKSTEIFDYEIELDRENETKVYEISFNSGNYEYEYELNAQTGKIIKSHKEFDD